MADQPVTFWMRFGFALAVLSGAFFKSAKSQQKYQAILNVAAVTAQAVEAVEAGGTETAEKK